MDTNLLFLIAVLSVLILLIFIVLIRNLKTLSEEEKVSLFLDIEKIAVIIRDELLLLPYIGEDTAIKITDNIKFRIQHNLHIPEQEKYNGKN